MRIKKGQMSLEMIVGLIILLVVAAVVINIFLQKVREPPEVVVKNELELESYRQKCQLSCQQYVDAGKAGSAALEYCSKYFEIDINHNGVFGEAQELNGFGLCEDRVYCFNMYECELKSVGESRLTPQKCRDIMCEEYTEKQGSNNTAAEYIASKIKFGSCSYDDSAISFTNSTGSIVTLGGWHKDIYASVHCRGSSG